MTKFKKVTCIAIFVVALFCIVILLLLFKVPAESIQSTSNLPASLQGKTDFDIAQFYFNSDDIRGGVYDIIKAQEYYEKVIAENPKENNLVWYQSGRIDFINGDFDLALDKFATQLAYHGDEIPNVYYMIGLTYGYRARQTNSPEDWKHAEDNFKKSVELLHQAPWPYVDLAWVYFSEGKYNEMKLLLEIGMNYGSNNPWLLNMYGLALLNTGDKTMAREYFLFAQELAQEVTVEQWGRSYPGNNPDSWEQGLFEFETMIAKNIELTN